MIRLAVDCDGVLSDSFGAWEGIAQKEGVTQPFDTTYNGIYKVRCEDGEIFANKLFGEYRDHWIEQADPYPEVVEFVDKMTWNEAVKWYVVTSRGVDTKDQTLAWLAKHNITGFEDVLFLQDKTKAPTQVIVDDHYKHIKAYTDKARMGFLLSRSYNRNYNVSRRVDNLLQVYNQILPFL